jgi:hypothetical protein
MVPCRRGAVALPAHLSEAIPYERRAAFGRPVLVGAGPDWAEPLSYRKRRNDETRAVAGGSARRDGRI